MDERVEALGGFLRRYVGSVRSSIADDALSTLTEFIRYGSDVYVTYSGVYVSPAMYLVLLLASLTKINAYLVDPEVIAYYVAPYADEGGTRRVIVVSSGGNGALARLLDQLELTGYDVMVLSFGGLPDTLRRKVDEGRLIEFESSDLLLQHLVLGLAVSNYLGRTGVRTRRLWYELSSLGDVVQDLVSRYAGKLLEVARFTEGEFLITCTPSMLGVAEDLAYNYSTSAGRYLIPLNTVKHYVRYVRRLLVVSTDVEEYSIRELRWLGATGAAEVCELRVGTDPLTAPIYGLILSKALLALSGAGCQEAA